MLGDQLLSLIVSVIVSFEDLFREKQTWIQ